VQAGYRPSQRGRDNASLVRSCSLNRARSGSDSYTASTSPRLNQSHRFQPFWTIAGRGTIFMRFRGPHGAHRQLRPLRNPTERTAALGRSPARHFLAASVNDLLGQLSSPELEIAVRIFGKNRFLLRSKISRPGGTNGSLHRFIAKRDESRERSTRAQ
jgi:hypothetical protein